MAQAIERSATAVWKGDLLGGSGAVLGGKGAQHLLSRVGDLGADPVAGEDHDPERVGGTNSGAS